MFLCYNVIMKLPQKFKPLLWSYNFYQIDPEKNKRTIIVSTIDYGDLTHWKWIIKKYGKENVARILSNVPASELRPGARKLASLIFGIKSFRYEKRSVN